MEIAIKVARTDWQAHSIDDLTKADFSNECLAFGLFLIESFQGTEYALCWAEDYSSENIIAQDEGHGDRRFIAWYEINGPHQGQISRVSALRLHVDNHIEASRSTKDFLEKFGSALQEYSGNKFYNFD